MRTRTNVRRIVAGAAAAAIAVAVPAFGARVSGASLSGCTSSTGVVVIVDFSHWGGTVERGCAPGQPATGLDALHDAGFTTAGTAQYGNAFVCRIDSHPSPSEQGCASTPPANAYWAYYHARWTDSGWTYNALGATSTHPAPGSIEAWAFGARVLPGVSPAAAVATVTTIPPPTTVHSQPPPTVTAPPATSGGTTPVGGTIAPTQNGAHGTISLHDSSAPTTAPPHGSRAAIAKAARAKARRTAVAMQRGEIGTTPTTTTAIAGARGGEGAGAGVVDRADAPAPPHEDSGSPVPTIVTVLALVAAGTTGALVVRNRRRQPA
jgi:hypothetical protein